MVVDQESTYFHATSLTTTLSETLDMMIEAALFPKISNYVRVFSEVNIESRIFQPNKRNAA